MIIYRGVSTHQRPAPGWFYHPDIEFARQFTQSGQFNEILKAELQDDAIYYHDPLPYGGDPDEVDGVIELAKAAGKYAIACDEGGGYEPSILVLKSALAKRAMKLLGRCTELDESYSPRSMLPKWRGNLTTDKVIKFLKSHYGRTLTGSVNGWKIMSEFDSPEELAAHTYWHGTGRPVSTGLRPSKAFGKRWADSDNGGGGYGEQYWGVSVSAKKQKASHFTGTSRFGTVYPVVVAKGAVIKHIPEMSDANELEEVILDLWKEGVDAVKIGNWNEHDEEELVILNPRAAWKGDGETYQVFNQKMFNQPTPEDLWSLRNKAKERSDHLKDEFKRKFAHLNPGARITESEQVCRAVDLDGTLANYDGWKGEHHIGEPVPKMLDNVKTWLEQGDRVVIFTARAKTDSAKAHITKWLLKHGLPKLEITNVKTPKMDFFYDDKAVGIAANTGQPSLSFVKMFESSEP